MRVAGQLNAEEPRPHKNSPVPEDAAPILVVGQANRHSGICLILFRFRLLKLLLGHPQMFFFTLSKKLSSWGLLCFPILSNSRSSSFCWEFRLTGVSTTNSMYMSP